MSESGLQTVFFPYSGSQTGPRIPVGFMSGSRSDSYLRIRNCIRDRNVRNIYPIRFPANIFYNDSLMNLVVTVQSRMTHLIENYNKSYVHPFYV